METLVLAAAEAAEALRRLQEEEPERHREVLLAQQWFGLRLRAEQLPDGRYVFSYFRDDTRERVRRYQDGTRLLKRTITEHREWIPVPYYSRDIGSAVSLLQGERWPEHWRLGRAPQGLFGIWVGEGGPYHVDDTVPKCLSRAAEALLRLEQCTEITLPEEL